MRGRREGERDSSHFQSAEKHLKTFFCFVFLFFSSTAAAALRVYMYIYIQYGIGDRAYLHSTLKVTNIVEKNAQSHIVYKHVCMCVYVWGEEAGGGKMSNLEPNTTQK